MSKFKIIVIDIDGVLIQNKLARFLAMAIRYGLVKNHG